MSCNSIQTQESKNLVADFQRILKLFEMETAIYKSQISILKDTIKTLQTNENNLINNMTHELHELRGLLTSISVSASNAANITNTQLVTPCISSDQRPQLHIFQHRKISDYLCQICLDNPRDCILEPCMHFCLCSGCVNQLPEPKCPICRRHIEFYQNVFIS